MKGGTISGVSQTQGSGGAIAVLTGGKANLSSGVISGCTANKNGGAVFVYLGGAVDISGTKIKSNSAGNIIKDNLYRVPIAQRSSKKYIDVLFWNFNELKPFHDKVKIN